MMKLEYRVLIFILDHFDGDEFVGVIQWDGEYGEKLF